MLRYVVSLKKKKINLKNTDFNQRAVFSLNIFLLCAQPIQVITRLKLQMLINWTGKHQWSMEIPRKIFNAQYTLRISVLLMTTITSRRLSRSP